MMTSLNRDTSAGRAFHAATSYYQDASGEFLADGEDPIWEQDLSLEPLPSKIYEDLTPIPLSRDLTPTTLPAVEALRRSGREGAGRPTLAALGRLGLLSNGLLNREQRRGTGTLAQFRTAGATGARYHLELYFICQDLPDLAAGVYHYGTESHSLSQLRSGDYRAALVDASGMLQALADAPVIMALTSTFWRNAWRYKARAYRHAYWDGGTSLANFLAVAASLDLRTEVVLGFVDDQVNRVIGVDGKREATLAVCAVGSGATTAPAVREIKAIDHRTRPVSASEVTFEHIPRMVAASRLHSGEDVTAWRSTPLRRTLRPAENVAISLEPRVDVPATPIEQIILARRSTRHYDTQQPISFESFSTVLECASRGFAADALAPEGPPLHDNYLIVHDVAGLEPGVYLHRVQEHAVELITPGAFRRHSWRLAFEQDPAGEAQVNSYYLADLDQVLECYGNRGYGLAQLEASLTAGRLHLAARSGVARCGIDVARRRGDRVLRAARAGRELSLRHGVRASPQARALTTQCATTGSTLGS